MKNLQILTNNHLGISFWEQRTGLFDSIHIDSLNLNSFNHLLEIKSNFILLDFYFSKIPMQKKLQMIDKFKQLTSCYECELKLFILSPTFADSELTLLERDNTIIVTHNFTNQFLIRLSRAIKNQQIKVSL